MRLSRLFLFAAAAGTAGEFRVAPTLVMVAMVIGIVELPAGIDRPLATVAIISSDSVGSPSGVSFLPDGRHWTASDDDAVIQPAHGSRPIAPLLIHIKKKKRNILKNQLDVKSIGDFTSKATCVQLRKIP